MVATSTRKELADNMRCFDVVSDAGGRYWLNGTLFGMDISARSEDVIRCGMSRLAAFIEPNPVESGGIDREALLELVVDLESYRLPISGISVAEHIREALGVTADG